MNYLLVFVKYEWLSSPRVKVNLEGLGLLPITFIAHEVGDFIVLLFVYDKGDASSVKTNVLKQIIKEEGYPF